MTQLLLPYMIIDNGGRHSVNQNLLPDMHVTCMINKTKVNLRGAKEATILSFEFHISKVFNKIGKIE